MDTLILVAPGVQVEAEMLVQICQTWRIWYAMRKRCRDKKNKDYGGRGISVCDRWENSFPLFLQDIGLKPSEEYSIDRIDVNGNYEPTNCRWATSLQQMRNRRKSDLCSRGHSMAENRIMITDRNVPGHERPVCRRCKLIRAWERKERIHYERRKEVPAEAAIRGDIFDCSICGGMIPMQKLLVDQIRRGSCVVECRDYDHFLSFVERAPDTASAIERRRAADKARKQVARDAARGDKPKFKKQVFKSHCKRGHPLEGDNLYFYDTKWGRQSRCVACQCIRNGYPDPLADRISSPESTIAARQPPSPAVE